MSGLPPLDHQPAWLVAAVDQRIAFMKEMTGGIEAMALAAGTPIIMAFLTEPEGESEAHFQKWEGSCDNCGKFQYFGMNPASIVKQVGLVTVVLAIGMCDECKALP